MMEERIKEAEISKRVKKHLDDIFDVKNEEE